MLVAGIYEHYKGGKKVTGDINGGMKTSVKSKLNIANSRSLPGFVVSNVSNISAAKKGLSHITRCLILRTFSQVLFFFSANISVRNHWRDVSSALENFWISNF